MEQTSQNIYEAFLKNDHEYFQNELESLVKECKKNTKRLDTIVLQSDRQQKKLMDLNEKLEEYQNHLEEKVQQEVSKRKEKEKMLFQQSKLAAMGEMMDAVAHQWKQPINIIKMQIDMMKYDFEDNFIDKKYITHFQNKICDQIEHTTSTLNEFRTFFRPNKATQVFDAKQMIKKTLLLMQDELLSHNIQTELNIIKNFSFEGVENEYKHLVLNILNNAKDAFEENHIKNKKLIININHTDTKKYFEIIDNAGGIPTDIIDDIFKANISTKTEGKGTGIGLYMSYQIAQKHNAILQAKNTQDGAKFILSIENFERETIEK